jgi:hypothetical protein
MMTRSTPPSLSLRADKGGEEGEVVQSGADPQVNTVPKSSSEEESDAEATPNLLKPNSQKSSIGGSR